MVSALLDELPCLIDEADELMARLSCHVVLLKTEPKGAPEERTSKSRDMDADSMEEDDFKQSRSPRHSSRPSQSTGKSPSNAELRQALDGVDVDAVVRFFARQYLTMQSMSFEKVNAYLPADVERSALHSVAASIYQLMKRVHHWQQTAWDALTTFLADNDSSESCLLTFDSHPQLTRLVLATVAKYVKVSLLWTSFRAIPGLLALYSFLQTTGDSGTGVFSPLEHTDHRVREFVLHFGSAPLLAIQHDFQEQVADKGASLAALALSCFERYEACRDLAQLRHQGVFDLEPLVSGAYASHSCLPDLLNNADVADWVICVVLCVPHQLRSGDGTVSLSPRSLPSSPPSPSSPTNAPAFLQLWGFMEIIARDRLVLTLHRSRAVNLHDLLYQQVTSSLSAAALTAATASASAMPSFGNSRSSMPLKKVMCALSKHALRSCGVNHRQRREVAAWLLRNCVQLLQHNPGLVAPSFPLLLAALAIARDEVEWIMSHGAHLGSTDGYKPPLLPCHIKPKHLQRVLASFSDAEKELADLLTSSHRLRGLMEQHSFFLVEYYQAFLVEGDAEGIALTIRDLLAANDSTSELQLLLEGFLDKERYRVNTSSRRATWEREWRQANAHLATRTRLPLLDELRARMESTVRHTRYISTHAQLLEGAANFSKCWWFRDVVFGHCFEQTLATAPSASIGLLEILSSLAAGNSILDELVDTEEATQQSERMLQRIDRMRASLVNQVELGLEAVVKRDANLQRDETVVPQEERSEQVEIKVTSSRRLSSYSRVQSSQVQRPSTAELRLASPTSSALNRNDSHINALVGRKPDQLANEGHYVELVHALLKHIGEHQQGDIVRNAILQRVQSSFTRFLRDFVGLADSAAAQRSIEGMALRCSPREACQQIRCFLRTTERLFGGNSSGALGIDDVPLGEALQAVLTKALATECSASASILPQDKRLLDWVGDAPRVSDKEILQWSLLDRISWVFVSVVTRRCRPSASAPVLASVRKGCFVPAPGVSGELDPRSYTDRDALQSLGALIGPAGVESVCSTIANLLVAQTLKLRSSIEAEHGVLAFMDMALSGNGSADVVLAPSQVRALDDMATQLVQIGTAAFLLQLVHDHSAHATKDSWEARVASRVVRELQQDPDRRATWTRLLPVACSSAFHASVWRSTTYLAGVEATDSNAHLMGLAMARLLHSSQAVHRCAVAALRRASTCARGAGPPLASRSKLSLQLGADPSARALLEALELLMTTATVSAAGHGSTLGELELTVERLLPRVVVALHSTA